MINPDEIRKIFNRNGQSVEKTNVALKVRRATNSVRKMKAVVEKLPTTTQERPVR